MNTLAGTYAPLGSVELKGMRLPAFDKGNCEDSNFDFFFTFYLIFTMCFNVKTLFSPSKKSKCYFYPISTKRRFSNLISRFSILNFRWETYKKPRNI